MAAPPGVPEKARLPVPGGSPTGLRVLAGEVIVMPGRGLRFPRQLPFDRWVGVGRQLSDVCTSSAWYLGDWLAYGEMTYRGRYRDAVEQTSLDYQTLRNYAWVVRRFPLSRRRDSLSFGHHAEVAVLPEAEQDFWLRKAEESRWPVKRLRSEVRASLSERSAGEPAGQDSPSQRPPNRLHLQLTPEQMHACHAAASNAGLPVQAWAIGALDQAARHEWAPV